MKETEEIKEVKKFGERGAHIYVTNEWLGKKVKVKLINETH